MASVVSIGCSASLSRLSIFSRLRSSTRPLFLSPSSLSFFSPTKTTTSWFEASNRFRLLSMASSEPKESPANNPGLHTVRVKLPMDTSCKKRCFELRTPKSVLISILVCWASHF